MMAVVVVGSTFAWFTYQSKRSALVLTIGDINNTQIELSPYQKYAIQEYIYTNWPLVLEKEKSGCEYLE